MLYGRSPVNGGEVEKLCASGVLMREKQTDSVVRAGVIGTGALGRHHARLYKQCRNVQLIGVFDHNTETAAQVGEELQTRAFSSLDEMLSQVQAVSLATPTNTHYELAKYLLANNLHVLVEKPLCGRVEEAEELVAMAGERNLLLHVGHVERYNPVLQCLDEIPGPPRFIEAHRMASYPPLRPGLPPRGTEVSVVLDLMIHELDVVLRIVDSRVEDVKAAGVAILSPSEDIANARLEFANGTVANLTASRVSERPMRRLRVFKNNAYLALDYQEQKGEIAYLRERKIVREPVAVKQSNALLDELQDFVDCLYSLQKHGRMVRQPRVTGEHGLEALRLADDIHQQIQHSTEKMGGI